jgi:hypothetical protein
VLTQAQLATLAAGLRASSDPVVVAALAIRNDMALADWCNTSSAVNAWNDAVDKRGLFEATDVAKFDNLTAGKRELWTLLLDNAPIDFSRQKMRKAVDDTWGSADSGAVLTACQRKATNAELILGATDATTNGVTAKKLDVPGLVTVNEVSVALNTNP